MAFTDIFNDVKQEFDEDSDDDYFECILDPNNDRRTIICDSHNSSDGIIHCIGSIQSQYIPDTNFKKTEKTHGTGTVIHIDDQNIAYVLTAAHNIVAVEKRCQQCNTKTITRKCPIAYCNGTAKKTGNLVKPTHIYFTRRGHGIKHNYKLGQTIQQYQIDDYKYPNQYNIYPSGMSGHDICVITFKCRDKDGIAVYKENCSKIRLVNDETFGGNKCVLHIYGFPYEKRKEKDFRVYYYLFGMGTSKLDSDKKFKLIKNNDTNKLYVVNQGIDTSPGESGAAIYSYYGNDDTRYLIYGIHSGGSKQKICNYGTFVDSDILQWIAEILAGKKTNLKNIMANKFIVSEKKVSESSKSSEVKPTHVIANGNRYLCFMHPDEHGYMRYNWTYSTTMFSPYDLDLNNTPIAKSDENVSNMIKIRMNWKVGDDVQIYYESAQHWTQKWIQGEIANILQSNNNELIVKCKSKQQMMSIGRFSQLIRPIMDMSTISTISCHAWNKEHNKVAISPNTSDIFIFSAKDKNSAHWKKITTLWSSFDQKVTGIDWNHKTNAIVASSEDKNALVWNENVSGEWKPTRVVLRFHRSATCIKWSPNGKKFAVGGVKQIAVCHYDSCGGIYKTKMIKKGGKSSIISVDWSPNNMFIIAGGTDFKCRVFSAYIKTVDTDCKVDDYKGAIDGKVASSFGSVLCEFETVNKTAWVECCRFSPSGMRFAFTGHNSSVYFGSFEGGSTTVQSIKRRDLPLKTIAFLTDNVVIAAGYDCVPVLYQYNGKHWIEKGSIDAGIKSKKNDVEYSYRHKGMINDIQVYGNTQFTTSSIDGTILFWDLKQKY